MLWCLCDKRLYNKLTTNPQQIEPSEYIWRADNCWRHKPDIQTASHAANSAGRTVLSAVAAAASEIDWSGSNWSSTSDLPRPGPSVACWPRRTKIILITISSSSSSRRPREAAAIECRETRRRVIPMPLTVAAANQIWILNRRGGGSRPEAISITIRRPAAIRRTLQLTTVWLWRAGDDDSVLCSLLSCFITCATQFSHNSHFIPFSETSSFHRWSPL